MSRLDFIGTACQGQNGSSISRTISETTLDDNGSTVIGQKKRRANPTEGPLRGLLNDTFSASTFFSNEEVLVEFDGSWHPGVVLGDKPAGLKVRFHEDDTSSVVAFEELQQRVRRVCSPRDEGLSPHCTSHSQQDNRVVQSPANPATSDPRALIGRRVVRRAAPDQQDIWGGVILEYLEAGAVVSLWAHEGGSLSKLLCSGNLLGVPVCKKIRVGLWLIQYDADCGDDRKKPPRALVAAEELSHMLVC